LFTPYRLGTLELPNRIVMPPMTRSRAAAGEVATELMARYYAQRASAGLIVSEGTQVSPQGQGYAWTPGIHAPAQVAGWRKVTDAVHAAGGRIFAQLWHVGRVSHVSLPVAAAPVVLGAAGRRREGVIDPTGAGPRPVSAAWSSIRCRALDTGRSPASCASSPAPRKTRWMPVSTAWSCTAPTAT
jgi:N-ethylmaleimide reductase